MKYFNILCFLLFVSFSANAQKTTSDTTSPDIMVPAEAPISSDDPIFTVVEQMPMFKGGDEAMFKYLKENTKYPVGLEKIGDKVYVSFVINKVGKPVEVKIMRGTNEKFNAEAIRVVKAMPAWTPGKQNGRAVNVRYALPIVFTPRK